MIYYIGERKFRYICWLGLGGVGEIPGATSYTTGGGGDGLSVTGAGLGWDFRKSTLFSSVNPPTISAARPLFSTDVVGKELLVYLESSD